MMRYKKLGNIDDLETGLQINQEVVDLTPVDHIEWTLGVQALANSFMERYERLKDPQDLECCSQNYAASFKASVFVHPEFSWKAAINWAFFAFKYRPSDLPIAISAGFSVLPEILWMGHAVALRHNKMSQLHIAGVTANAVSTCIHMTNTNLTTVIEILDQGLAIIFQQTLQLRTDPDELSSEDAQVFKKLSADLYSGTAVDAMTTAIQRKDLLDKIRKQPEHEYFLLPKPYIALCQASQRGPVVMLNSHGVKCDAIILLGPTLAPLHVPLTAATLVLLKSQKEMLHEVLNRCNVRTRDQAASTRLFGCRERYIARTTEECFNALLEWQWTNIVEPIYQALTLVSCHLRFFSSF
jgi:hypothetical protein